MTKREKIAALLRITVDRGCTAAEAATARRLAAKLHAERVLRQKRSVTMDLHKSHGPRITSGRR